MQLRKCHIRYRKTVYFRVHNIYLSSALLELSEYGNDKESLLYLQAIKTVIRSLSAPSKVKKEER